MNGGGLCESKQLQNLRKYSKNFQIYAIFSKAVHRSLCRAHYGPQALCLTPRPRAPIGPVDFK